jgi:GNAT superfamily N-acetyltransferase
MIPYLIAGAIGFVVAKIFDEDEAPKYEDGGFIKIKSFKSNEGEFDVYDVDENHKNRADMFVVFKDKKGWVVRNVIVPKEYQRKGIATKFYINMNKMSLKNTGKPLHSTQTRKLSNGQIVHELSEDGIAFWDSLVRDGYAKKISEKNYVFIHNEFSNGGLIAPNGKPSNLTPEQYKLVRTRAFKKWFGDWQNDPETASKVVDENGEPLVVYHSTNIYFNVFKAKYNNDGISLIYFTDKKIVAEKYGNILKKFFLKIEKLNEIDVEYKGFNDAYDNTSLEGELRYTEEGLLIKNIYDDPSGKKKGKISNIYAVKYPEQIKLADGTNTTFDGSNPDIRFDGGGDIKKVKFNIESKEGEEDRTTISIKGIGEVVLVETFPEYEFLEDIGEDGLEELGVEEGDMIGKIEHLEINDKYKGKGYAKLLMNKAIEVAKEKGLMPLYLNASPMGSKRYGLNIEDLTGFYQTFGFEVFLEQGNNNLMILKDSNNPDIRFKNGGELELYHGSEKKFKNFKTNLIDRTDYGWGIYFTDSEDVAKFYARRPFDRDIIRQKIIESKFSKEEKFLLIDTFVLNLLDLEKSKKTLDKKYHPLINQIQKEVQNKSFVYEADVLNEKWLYWDKKVPVDIKRILKNIDDKYFINGETLYNYLTDKLNTQKNASLFLLDKGINGIKYLITNNITDSNIEGYNYVVFDVDDIQIKSISKYADGGSVLLAPNGKPSNLTPEQYKLVRTPEFKAWFGDWEYLANFNSNYLEISDVKDYVNAVIKNDDFPKRIKPNSILHFKKVYDYILSSDENGKIIGALTIYPNGKIDQLAISEKMRGKGIGKKMIDLAIEMGATSIATYSKYSKNLVKYFLDKTISKVIDENGEPLPVYHGTDNKFSIFEITKIGSQTDMGYYGKGFYFTPIKNYAKSFTRKGIILEFFIKLLNPSFLDLGSIEQKKDYLTGNNDGLILNMVFSDLTELREVVAKFPEQIKLADGTNTTFDGSNPDIRFDEGGDVEYYGDYQIEIKNEYEYIITALKNGKRVGLLTFLRNPYTSKNGELYILVDRIDVIEKERGYGLATKMYQYALKHLPKKYKGIASDLKNRVNKNEIPKIYSKFNNKIESWGGVEYHLINNTDIRFDEGGDTKLNVDRYREIEKEMFELKKQGKSDTLEYFKLIKERSIL